MRRIFHSKWDKASPSNISHCHDGAWVKFNYKLVPQTKVNCSPLTHITVSNCSCCLNSDSQNQFWSPQRALSLLLQSKYMQLSYGRWTYRSHNCVHHHRRGEKHLPASSWPLFCPLRSLATEAPHFCGLIQKPSSHTSLQSYSSLSLSGTLTKVTRHTFGIHAAIKLCPSFVGGFCVRCFFQLFSHYCTLCLKKNYKLWCQ